MEDEKVEENPEQKRERFFKKYMHILEEDKRQMEEE